MSQHALCEPHRLPGPGRRAGASGGRLVALDRGSEEEGYNSWVRFEWDLDKAASNASKHGVSEGVSGCSVPLAVAIFPNFATARQTTRQL